MASVSRNMDSGGDFILDMWEDGVPEASTGSRMLMKTMMRKETFLRITTKAMAMVRMVTIFLIMELMLEMEVVASINGELVIT